MNRDQILSLPSMPPASPSYPKGPYRFIDREYLIIRFKSDPAIIRDQLPEPLEPDGSDTVLYEFINMPNSSGFGKYVESGVVIPAKFEGEDVNFTAQMYLDDEPPITGGREIWGFPKKFGQPKLETVHDTLTGTLHYAGQQVALGTMRYKEHDLTYDRGSGGVNDDGLATMTDAMGKTQVNLKLIPEVDGQLDSPGAIAQLVAYNMTDINIKGAWRGAAALHLVPHVNAPVGIFPVREVMEGYILLGI